MCFQIIIIRYLLINNNLYEIIVKCIQYIILYPSIIVKMNNNINKHNIKYKNKILQ